MFVMTLFLSVFASAIALPALAQACSVCFSGDNDALTHAFNWSVGFLLVAPYVVAGTIAGCLTIAYKRAVARRAADDAQAGLEEPIYLQEESLK